ncbi:MAG: arabinogalactan endo-beta-1,4-galactanase [Salibacteraceae bacterium]
MQWRWIWFGLLVFALWACEKDSSPPTAPSNNQPETQELVRALDLSYLPEIEAANVNFLDEGGNPVQLLAYCQERGVNTIRVRLWHTPATAHSGWQEVEAFSRRIHEAGLQLWITLHYSDTWADPNNQQVPQAWQGLDFATLKDRVYEYTQRVVATMQPEWLQIGNEINPGFMWPYGNYPAEQEQFVALIAEASRAIRATSDQTQIMLHSAGHAEADFLLQTLQAVDYDCMGISYYPKWHGKDLAQLATNLQNLHQKYQKPIMIAETAYPFSLGWNDWTNNILGWESDLHPDYPASPQGQLDFLLGVRSTVESLGSEVGMGYCYWGGEWVAYKGPQATNGSTWENQALFDFDLKALPVWAAFQP